MAFNVLAGMQHVQDGFEQGRQRGERNRFAALTESAMAGDPTATAQQYAINPQQASQVQAGADLTAQKLRGAAKYMRGAVESGNPAAVQGAWNAVRPMLSRVASSTGKPPPPEQWDPASLPAIEQVLAQTAYLEGGADGVPAQLQTFEAMTRGLPEDEVARARRIQLGLDPRASSAGQQTISVTGPDGRDRQFTFDPRSGNYVPADFGAAPAAPAPLPQGGSQQVVDAVLASANRMAQQGIPAEQIDVWIAQQPGFGAQLAAPSAASPFVSRAPEEQAALTTGAQEQARADAEFRNYDRMTGLVADRAAEEARAKAGVEIETDRTQAAPKKLAGYRQALEAAGNVKTSIGKALDMISPMSTGFLGARSRGIEGTPAYNLAAEIETIKANLGFDRLQQMRDNSPTGGALGQVAIQELIALQSTVANLDPNQSGEQLRDNIQRIRDHYDRWEATVQQAMQREQAVLQGAQGQGSPQQPSSDIDALLEQYR